MSDIRVINKLNEIEQKLNQVLEEFLLTQNYLSQFVKDDQESGGLGKLYFQRVVDFYRSKGLQIPDLLFALSDWLDERGYIEVRDLIDEAAARSPNWE